MDKAKLILKLRKHLSTLFDARYQGTARVDYARHQGVVDGYMEAMEDMKLIGDAELIRIVGQERDAAVQKADAALPQVSTVAVENFA